MTITRRELLKDGVIAAASALPLANLISESGLFSSKTETPELQGATRVWFNNHMYDFGLTNVQITLGLSQWIKTNSKGVHFDIGERYFSVVTSYRDPQDPPQDPQRGEWRMCNATNLFNLDADRAEGWEIHRQRAMGLLDILPSHAVRSNHLKVFRYDYQQALREQASAVAATRVIKFIRICERFACIIGRMTPPDQIIVETYPELASGQAVHGSH